MNAVFTYTGIAILAAIALPTGDALIKFIQRYREYRMAHSGWGR